MTDPTALPPAGGGTLAYVILDSDPYEHQDPDVRVLRPGYAQLPYMLTVAIQGLAVDFENSTCTLCGSRVGWGWAPGRDLSGEEPTEKSFEYTTLIVRPHPSVEATRLCEDCTMLVLDDPPPSP